VAAAVPGLFSVDASGRGQGAILNQDNSALNPAEKGSIIQRFGTGDGVTNPAGVDGRVNTGERAGAGDRGRGEQPGRAYRRAPVARRRGALAAFVRISR
jgi:hypothetical protein